MPTRLKVRRDTAARWSATNPILADGEIGFEKATNKLKIGDGAAAWNSLPYVVGGSPSIPLDVIRTSTVGLVLYQADNTIVGDNFVAAGYYLRTSSGWDFPPALQDLSVERFSITTFPYTVTLADAQNDMIFLSPTAAAAVTLPANLIGFIAPANRRLWLDVVFVVDPAFPVTFSPGAGATLFVAGQPGAQTSYVVTGPKKTIAMQTRGTTWRHLG